MDMVIKELDDNTECNIMDLKGTKIIQANIEVVKQEASEIDDIPLELLRHKLHTVKTENESTADIFESTSLNTFEMDLTRANKNRNGKNKGVKKISREDILERKREYEQRRRDSIKNDPTKSELEKQKEKERYLRQKKEGKVKMIGSLTPQEQRLKRKKWKENNKNARKRRADAKKFESLMYSNTSPDTPSVSDDDKLLINIVNLENISENPQSDSTLSHAGSRSNKKRNGNNKGIKKISREDILKRKRECEQRRRDSIKNDPTKSELEKQKEKERYLRRKKEGKVKMIGSLTPQEQRLKRKKWKENNKNARKRRADAKKFESLMHSNTSPDTSSVSDDYKSLINIVNLENISENPQSDSTLSHAGFMSNKKRNGKNKCVKKISREDILKRKRECEQRRRDSIKNDPTKSELEKQKEKERYLRRKKEGKVKMIGSLTPQEQRLKRKKWKQNNKNARKKKAAAKKLESVVHSNTPLDTPSVSDDDKSLINIVNLENISENPQSDCTLSEAGTSQKNCGREKVSRVRFRMYQKLKEKETEVKTLKRKVDKYRKRYERLFKKWLKSKVLIDKLTPKKQ